MNNIEERAKEFADNYVVGDAAIITDLIHITAKNSYWHGAIDQRRIDIDKACEWLKDNGCFSYLKEGSQTVEDVEKIFRQAMNK